MYLWTDFRESEVREDFERFARQGFDYLRVTLSWEAFQPGPRRVDPVAIKRLKALIRIAEDCGLKLTLAMFMGHMSGANFVPPWLIAPPGKRGRRSSPRFSVVSGGRTLAPQRLIDFWADPSALKSQHILLDAVLDAVGSSPAVDAIDLGNESDNVLPPAEVEHAVEWLSGLAARVRKANPRLRVTLGFHGDNLFTVKRLNIHALSRLCDFVSFHPYPHYTPWIDDPLDTDFFPFIIAFLHALTGKPVFIQEFGLPAPKLQKADISRIKVCLAPKRSPRVFERQRLFSVPVYQKFILSALRKTRVSENLGMLLWCAHDYGEDIWNRPPLDTAAHERFFGFYDADGRRKTGALDLSKIRRIPVRSVAGRQILPELLAMYRDQKALESCPEGERTRLWRKAYRRFKAA